MLFRNLILFSWLVHGLFEVTKKKKYMVYMKDDK